LSDFIPSKSLTLLDFHAAFVPIWWYKEPREHPVFAGKGAGCSRIGLREEDPVMERTFGDNWRNAVLGLALTVAVIGGGLAAALW